MVSDDKNKIYKNLKSSGSTKKDSMGSYSKPSSKFASVPSSEKINLYSAICSDCHSEVKINFEPVKTEPFYCDYCFSNHRIHHSKGK